MNADPLLDLTDPVLSLTLETAFFHKRLGLWREGKRCRGSRYTWDAQGRLLFQERAEERVLLSYDDQGRLSSRYELAPGGQVLAQEVWERDAQGRSLHKKRKTLNSPEEELWVYKYDQGGGVVLEYQKDRVRVEKRSAQGLLIQEYFHKGEEIDQVIEYGYNSEGQLISQEKRDAQGSLCQRLTYERDERGRVTRKTVQDSQGGLEEDEIYSYGVSSGANWLARTTWIPARGKQKKITPVLTVYRSFALREQSSSQRNLGEVVTFANGSYQGALADGLPQGWGIFQGKDKTRYQGHFQAGQMEGSGVMLWADERRMEGIFHQGRLEGEGLCHWPDGSEYRGNFRSGEIHGEGIFTNAEGKVFSGLFDQGKWMKIIDLNQNVEAS